MSHPFAALVICLGVAACSLSTAVRAHEPGAFSAGSRVACAMHAALAEPLSADADDADLADLIDAHYQLTAFGRRV